MRQERALAIAAVAISSLCVGLILLMILPIFLNGSLANWIHALTIAAAVIGCWLLGQLVRRTHAALKGDSSSDEL